MRSVSAIFLFFISQLTYAAAAVENTRPKNIPSLTNEPVGLGNYLQMFLGLILVVGLIIGVAWIMRRMNNMGGISADNLKVVGGVSIGQRERIVLVQAGNTQLLVGVGPGTIRTLHVLDEPITTNNPSVAVSSGFAEKLHAAIKSRGNS